MTDKLKQIASNASLVCFSIAGISVAALATAYTAEYGFGLKPCPLCLYQRIPYAATIALGLTGAFFSLKLRKEKLAAFAVFLSSLVFFTGAAIAFYHTGVEHHWWKSFLEGCEVTFGTGNPEDILKQIESAAAVRCDAVAWADPVLNISMAGWNAIASALLGVGYFISSILITRKANGF